MKKKQEEEEERKAANKPVVVKSKAKKKEAAGLDDLLSAGLAKGKKKWLNYAQDRYHIELARRMIYSRNDSKTTLV